MLEIATTHCSMEKAGLTSRGNTKNRFLLSNLVIGEENLTFKYIRLQITLPDEIGFSLITKMCF